MSSQSKKNLSAESLEDCLQNGNIQVKVEILQAKIRTFSRMKILQAADFRLSRESSNLVASIGDFQLNVEIFDSKILAFS
jgi:hypothetical protein